MIAIKCVTSWEVSAAVGSSMTTIRALTNKALAISTVCCWATVNVAAARLRIDRQPELLKQLVCLLLLCASLG